MVNEAIADNGKIRKSIWSQIENFIPKCFQWAHHADRHAHLTNVPDSLFSNKPTSFCDRLTKKSIIFITTHLISTKSSQMGIL
ncbi:endo-1,4-beta-xylanase [Spirulina sp. 06S082]|uniref:endo-1,4-beta-xylanase n=1 Tax=Spirulina sp. 06S082 TaxID=3110248 RepID=UPI003A4E47B2